MANKTLVVIDGKSVFYRGYYALPNLSTKDGTPTGGVYGFAVMALEVLKKMQPDYVCVAWDKPKTNIRRRVEIYDKYKANRKPAPPDFYEQVPLLHELLEAFGWPLYEIDDHEADDIMGTFAAQAHKKGINTILVTSDHDVLQLLNGHTKVASLKRGLTEVELFDGKRFKERYHMEPEQFIDYKALRGDSSDNVPGVPGIGEKTAQELIAKYDSLDGVYKHLDELKPALKKKLEDGKDSAYMSRELVELDLDVPLKLDFKAADTSVADPAKIAEALRKLEFRSLLNQLPQQMQAHVKPDTPAAKLDAPTRIERLSTKEHLDETKHFGSEPMVMAALAKGAQGQDPYSIILSPSHEVAYVVDLEQLSAKDVRSWLLDNMHINKRGLIGYDLKNCIKILLRLGVEDTQVEHDVRIGAFLINGLIRSQSLSQLTQEALGVELELDNLPPEDFVAQAPSIVAAIWQLYKRQTKGLGNMTKVATLAKDIEWPVVPVLAKMEIEGIKIDTKYLAKMSEEMADWITDLEQTIYGHANEEFNISSPIQLADVLFSKLKLGLPTNSAELGSYLRRVQGKAEQRSKTYRTYDERVAEALTQQSAESTNGVTSSDGEQVGAVRGGWSVKKTKTGYSTAATELAKLQPLHPIIGLITQYREVTKLKSTYVDALPKLIDENSKLHTTFDLDVAPTGRLSSRDPNLQNIPIRTELGKKIRKAFVTEKGRVFVSGDYSQFELRIAAYLSDDKEMIKLFNEGHDVHRETAARVYGIPPGKVTPDQRRDAKVVNFGITYGLSPHGLSEATGMTNQEAKAYIDKYFEVRHKLFDYVQTIKKQAVEEGYVETMFGRRRPTPDTKSSNYMVREAALRQAVNMPFQGSAADIMKMAMAKIDEKLKGECKQILQIHDSILVECPEKEAEKTGAMMKEVMESVVKLPVKLQVDIKTGKDWGEL